MQAESLTAALARGAATLHVSEDLDETLDSIARAAVASLPGIDHAGITIAYRKGRLETRASTSPVVRELDQLQYELGEGPCLYAMDAKRVVIVNDLRHEQRWPAFVTRAAEMGVRSQMGVQLHFDNRTMGGLNLYGFTSDVLDPEIEHGAELLAAHAALALGYVRSVEDLNAGLQSRKVIGQALGILMERHGLHEDKAFAYLRRMSSIHNVKLRDIAAHLVEEANADKEGPVA
jgi:GAF domain-containing protein